MLARPLLLAHRGAHSRSIRENTTGAFDRALDQGCDGFECDVRRTQCGCAVICHDSRVNNLTVSRSLFRQLPGLPALEDIVRRYGQRGFLDIELKVRGLESLVLMILRKYPPVRGHVISSFLPDVALELKARSAVVPVGIICGKAGELMAWRSLPTDFVIARHNLITRKLVQIIQDSGRKIFAWNVNDSKVMLRLAGWGVDAILSDKPEVMLRAFASPTALISS